MISDDSNQSSRCPRSISNCRAIIAIDRAANPVQSSRARVWAVLPASETHTKPIAISPGGTIIKKHCSPTVDLGDHAADYGADDRADDAAEAPNHHDRGVQLAGKGGKHDSLTHRHDHRATQPLPDAVEDQRFKTVCEAAQK